MLIVLIVNVNSQSLIEYKYNNGNMIVKMG